MVLGNRDKDKSMMHMKAVRIRVAGKQYDMYPAALLALALATVALQHAPPPLRTGPCRRRGGADGAPGCPRLDPDVAVGAGRRAVDRVRLSQGARTGVCAGQGGEPLTPEGAEGVGSIQVDTVDPASKEPCALPAEDSRATG